MKTLLFAVSLVVTATVTAQQINVADLATSDASSAAVIRNSSSTHLLRVEGTGRMALGGTVADLGAYKMQVTVTGADWTFLRLKATGSPALAGIVFDRGTTGFYQGLDNYGYLRVGPMATMDQTGLTNAKDQYSGLTLAPNGNGAFGISPENIGEYRMALTVSGPKWPYLRLRGHNGGLTEDPFLTGIILDRGDSNTVLASRSSYDTTVAGVVSAQPGIILGEGGEGQEQIATTGRVRVKVDASRAPVAIGDLLVTSDRPGFAMKSIPVEVAGIALHRPGTIVGKALEPLAGGTGEILVLLSLQ